jgi:hypothetical protein
VSARSRSEAETTAKGWPTGRGLRPSNHRAQNRNVYVIHEDDSGRPALRPLGQLKLFKIASCDFVEHGADAAIAKKDN